MAGGVYVSVRSKRKPPLDPEENVGTVDSTSVSLTPPGDPGEHGSETMVVPAMLLDAMHEPDELTPVGWVCNDVTMWWPEPREAVIDAHRLYARNFSESFSEAWVNVVAMPVCAHGSEPQWERPHACRWVDDIAQGIYPPPVEPMQQGEDSLGGCRVVLINTADHEEDS
jgi:hypothetical protein